MVSNVSKTVSWRWGKQGIPGIMKEDARRVSFPVLVGQGVRILVYVHPTV